MADAVLFEFLHTEMVAELWAHDPDSGPGVSAGSPGEEERAAARRPGRGPGEGGTPALPCWATSGAGSSSVKRGRRGAGLAGHCWARARQLCESP